MGMGTPGVPKDPDQNVSSVCVCVHVASCVCLRVFPHHCCCRFLQGKLYIKASPLRGVPGVCHEPRAPRSRGPMQGHEVRPMQNHHVHRPMAGQAQNLARGCAQEDPVVACPSHRGHDVGHDTIYVYIYFYIQKILDTLHIQNILHTTRYCRESIIYRIHYNI